VTPPLPRLADRARLAGVRAGRIRSRHAMVPDMAIRAALAGTGWQCERMLPSVSDTALLLVRADDGRAGFLKVAASDTGMASLRREDEVLRALHAQQALAGWRELLPRPLRAGQAAGGAYLLSTRLPGRDARRAPAADGGRLTAAAAAAIAPLHGLTAAPATVTTAMLGSWVDDAAAWVCTAVPSASTVASLTGELHALLAGRTVLLGWTHGDFFPGNLLLGADGQVTGIVDWAGARPRDLVALDVAFWLLTAPVPGRRRSFGADVAARLRHDRCWTATEWRLLAPLVDGGQQAGRAILLLTWLRHVAGNLAKSDRYALSPLWRQRAIMPVLRRAGTG
jgi:aminoglycoside phosphotransferase